MQAAVWHTVRWSVMLGAGLSAASLLLAWSLARQITRPIDQLRLAFADVSAEPGKPIETGPPEILDLQDTLYRATVERINSNQALMSALSNLEREMALREEAQANAGAIAAHGSNRTACWRHCARLQQCSGGHLLQLRYGHASQR